MAEERRKAAQRRKASQDGFFDDETTIIAKPPKPTRCKVEGCDRKHKARKMCEMHYRRWRRAQGRAN